MASTGEVNPKRHGADAEKVVNEGGSQSVEDKVYRLTRLPPEARDAPDTDPAAAPAAKERPDDREWSGEPQHPPAPVAPQAPKKSRKRIVMFALLPVEFYRG